MTIDEAIKELQESHDIMRSYNLDESESRLMTALEMAIKALKQTRWIPVSKPPKESYNSVIGWDAYRERCVFVQYIDGHFQIMGTTESFDIKAWMPLPPSYKESEDEK